MIRDSRAEEIENTWEMGGNAWKWQEIERTVLFFIPGSQERGSKSLNTDKSCSIILKKKSYILRT